MTNPLTPPSELEKHVEAWGVKHLNGMFMFEPAWLRARDDLVELIEAYSDKRVQEALYAVQIYTDESARKAASPYVRLKNADEAVRKQLATLRNQGGGNE